MSAEVRSLEPLAIVDLLEAVYSLPIEDACIDAVEYARTALPESVWRAPGRIFVHYGLFAEYKLLASIPDIFSHTQISSPHPNLQERFFSLGDDALISNVIGRTRLIHNLMLLRLLSVKQEHICVIEEQSDFAAQYTIALNALVPNRRIDRVVLSFNSDSIMEVWRDTLKGKYQITRCSGPLLKVALVQTSTMRILLVHLTSVYGTQVVSFVDVLREAFGLQELLLFGACGGLAPEVLLHDTVFVRRVLDETGRVLIEGNQLLSVVSDYPNGLTGFHRSHVADASSALCIPSETRNGLERLAQAGAAVVDLELSPLARYLSRHKSLRWGAALHVSDRPLMPVERLGTIPLLGTASKARQNEAFSQATVAARSWAFPTRSEEYEPSISWKLVSGNHHLAVWEAVLESREGQAITIHAVPIPLDKLTLLPAVNSSGQGYVWKEEIVRGMMPWDHEHMVHMNHYLRKSPQEYLTEVEAASVVAILNGNGNLYWNLGHFVFVQGKLYHHFRERLCGSQTVLLQDAAGLRLATVMVEELGRNVDFAVSGCRIIRQGEPADLFSVDPQTNRPLISEFYGDMTHVLHGFGLSLSLTRRIFAEASRAVTRAGRSYYAKAERTSPVLMDAVCGHPITCVLSPDESITAVRRNLNRYGYSERHWGEQLVPGTFAIHKDDVLAFAYRRSTLGHSVIASTEDPKTLLLINIYTDQDRKGFTLEDTAHVVLRAALSLGHRVEDALIISNSGDPRIILRRNEELVCLQTNSHGELLLFKGGVDYGLTSVLMVVERT